MLAQSKKTCARPSKLFKLQHFELKIGSSVNHSQRSHQS